MDRSKPSRSGRSGAYERLIIRAANIGARMETALERHLTLIFLLSVAVIVALGVFYFSRQQQQSHLHAEETLSAIADLKVWQIAKWFDDRKAIAQGLADDPMITEHCGEFLQAPPGRAPEETLLKGLAGFLQTRDISALALYDVSGRLRLVVPPAQKAQVPERPDPRFLAAQRSNQVVFRDLEFFGAGEDINLGFWIPIQSSADGSPQGAILMILNPHEFLFPLIQKPPFPSATAETLLIRRENGDAVYLNDLRHRADTALRLRIPIAPNSDLPGVKAALGSIGMVAGKDYRGVPVLAACQRVPGTPWFLVAKIDRKEIGAPLKRIAWTAATITFLSVLVTALIAGMTSRRWEARRYRLLFESNPQPMWVYDAETFAFLTVNNAAIDQYGFSREEFLSMTIKDIRPARDVSLLLQTVHNLPQGLSHSGQWRHQKKDGTIITVNVVSHGLTFEGRRARLVLAEDITERNRAEDALRQNEAIVVSILNSLPQSVFWKDRNGVYLGCNDVFARMVGLENRNGIIGRTDSDLPWNPLDAEAYRTDDKGVIQSKKAKRHIIETIRKADGTVIWVDTSKLPLFDQDGEVYGVLGVFDDITERKRSEEEEYRLRQMLRLVLDNIPQRVFWKDRDSRFLGCNKHFAEDSGLADVKELVGKDDFQMSWRSNAEAYRADDRWVMEHDSPKLGFEEPQDATGQLRRWLRTNKVPLRDLNGQIIGVLGTYEDITELKRAEEQIRTINAQLEQRVLERTAELQNVIRELESFSYSVSHDLRTPLRAIDGWAQVILEDHGERLGEEGRERLARLRAAVQRMARLIDDLLQFSRLSRQPLNKELVAASTLVRRALAEVQIEDRYERAFDKVVIGELPDCRADASLLTQAFVNLLSNALKFSSERSDARVEVGAFKNADGECVYFVKDNGVGFDMAHAGKLFGAFQRLHGSEFPGTGIGLALVQRIIQRHGGRIWAESSPGQGATFFFTLNETDQQKEAG